MTHDSTGAAHEAVPWGLRDMVAAGLATLALMFVGLLTVVAAGLVAGLDLQDPQNQTFLGFAALGLEALMIPPVWWWGMRKHGAGAAILGLRRAPLARTLVYVAIGLPALLAMNVAWGLVMERFGLEGQGDILPLFGQGLVGLLGALVVAAVVAPVAEELFFRGFLFAGLRDRWGLAAGMLISSAVFGAVHLTPGVMLPIALMGALFAWLYQTTRSLWPAILLHGLYNGVAVLAMYLAKGL